MDFILKRKEPLSTDVMMTKRILFGDCLRGSLPKDEWRLLQTQRQTSIVSSSEKSHVGLLILTNLIKLFTSNREKKHKNTATAHFSI